MQSRVYIALPPHPLPSPSSWNWALEALITAQLVLFITDSLLTRHLFSLLSAFPERGTPSRWNSVPFASQAVHTMSSRTASLTSVSAPWPWKTEPTWPRREWVDFQSHLTILESSASPNFELKIGSFLYTSLRKCSVFGTAFLYSRYSGEILIKAYFLSPLCSDHTGLGQAASRCLRASSGKSLSCCSKTILEMKYESETFCRHGENSSQLGAWRKVSLRNCSSWLSLLSAMFELNDNAAWMIFCAIKWRDAPRTI